MNSPAVRGEIRGIVIDAGEGICIVDAAKTVELLENVVLDRADPARGSRAGAGDPFREDFDVYLGAALFLPGSVISVNRRDQLFERVKK